MTPNPIGLHINANEVGDSEKLLRTLRAWKPAAVLVMNALNASDPGNIVMRILRTMQEWDGIVIYRQYENDEGHLWEKYSPQAYLQKLLNFGNKEFWFNVGNEPAPDAGPRREAMDKWYAEFIKLTDAHQLRVAIPGGFAVASFEKYEIERGDFDRMLRAIGERADQRMNGWCRVLFASHEYGHAMIPIMTAGRDPRELIDREKLQPENWPTKAQIFDADTSDNWILFRDEWYIDRIRTLTGKTPDVVKTEWFMDRLPNIEEQFPDLVREIDRIAGGRIKGIPTLIPYWTWVGQAMKPQPWTAAKVVCEQWQWFLRVKPAHHKAVCVWAWTWHNAKPDYWKDTGNIGEWNDLLELWPSYLVDTPQPAPTLPDKEDPAWQLRLAKPLERVGVNVRAEPKVTSKRVDGIAYGGSVVKHIPFEALSSALQQLARPADGEWYLVQLIKEKVIGWASSRYLRLETVPDEDRGKLLAIIDQSILAEEKAQRQAEMRQQQAEQRQERAELYVQEAKTDVALAKSDAALHEGNIGILKELRQQIQTA
ncbi:MAG: SH3 domain-containing protein [Anaerolineae bacterium]|nr:SH3 domain-containing protein [Anaerolineae bacterium]